MAIIPFKKGGHAIVDDNDLEMLNHYTWRKHHPPYAKKPYAVSTMKMPNGKKRIILMHRFIMKPSAHERLDHINDDGLDNRRCNLRIADHSQNGFNSTFRKGLSGFRGVSYVKGNQFKPWVATIMVHKKSHYLGRFAEPEEAAKAYDEAAKRFAGEFARLNFP